MQLLPILKALADDTRLRLCRLLAGGELNVNEIARVLGMGQSRVSRHLKILTEAGLLAPRRDGLWVYYAAARPPGAQALLAAVESLLRAGPDGREDLQRAAEVLRERGRTTRRFFDSVAGSWEGMKRDILGGFDLNGAVAGLLAETAAGSDAAAAPAGAADSGSSGERRWRTALEVGCGTGELLALLAGRAGQVIGVDASPGMLQRARRRFEGRPGVELRLGEAEHLPARDGEADLVVMSLVLHHLSSPLEGLREAARALQAGRLFLLAEFDRHGEETLRERFGDRWLGFPPATVEGWLEEAGFEPAGRRDHELRPGLRLALYISKKRPEGG